MKIIQVAKSYLRGDGVGNVVIEFDKIIRAEGYDTEIWAEELTNKDLENVTEDSILLYHMQASADLFIQNFSCRKILVFHNITYPELFSQYNDADRDHLAWGWYELRLIKDSFEGAIVFSEFSKKCLVDMGWNPSRIFVIPILLRFDKFKRDYNNEIVNVYCNKYTNIVFMGRLSPNKKQEDIIETFTVFRNKYCKNTKLFLIGKSASNKYRQMLTMLIEERGLQDDIIMPGFTPFADYIAYYKMADVFICMSAHEGFCIPLVEAMYFNVPIVAVRGTAIEDTLGGAGLLLDTREPEEVAKELNRLVCNERLRSKVITGQNERLKELSPKVLEPAYGKLLSDIIGSDNRITNNKRKYKNIQLPHRLLRFSENDDLKKKANKKIIICGAGRIGLKLKIWLSEEKVASDLILCDSNPDKAEDKQGVILLSDAADRYKEDIFIISVQNRRSSAEIYHYLISVNIPGENIFFYDAQKEDFK